MNFCVILGGIWVHHWLMLTLLSQLHICQNIICSFEATYPTFDKTIEFFNGSLNNHGWTFKFIFVTHDRAFKNSNASVIKKLNVTLKG